MVFKKGNCVGNLFQDGGRPWNKGRHTRPKFYEAYQSHKDNAKARGITFLLTFNSWLKIWKNSGRLKQRGRGSNQYVMARIGDQGPYAIDNVKIITNRENTQEFKPTKQQKENHRRGLLGNTNKLGKTESEETRRKKSLAHLGSAPTKGCTGMIWITTGINTQLIDKEAQTPLGYYRGRTL